MHLNGSPRAIPEILADINSSEPKSHCDDPKIVGQRLKELREKRGLSQRQLAFPGCSAAYISRLEAGERRPSNQILHRLARRLYTPTSYLAHGVGDPSYPPTDAIMALAGKDHAKGREMTALAVELRLALVRAGRL